MEEKVLMKLSLAVSLVGLCLLIIAGQGREIEHWELVQADNALDREVLVEGVVLSSQMLNQTAIISLRQELPIKLIAYRTANMSLKPGTRIRAEGESREYKGKAELVVDWIRAVS